MLVVLLYGLVRVCTERTSSPEAGRGLGIVAVVFLLLLLLAGAAVFLNRAARKQSVSALARGLHFLLAPSR
jgi:prolipoprotein diacylglyceryltransferase